MRKIIFLMHVSLDGYVATLDGNIDWIIHNEEIAESSYSMHGRTDTAIYGRITYQMMEAYWPTVLEDPDNAGDDLSHAKWVDQATKIVVSTTLESTNWNNTIIIKSNVAEEIKKYKQTDGKDIWLLGSPTLAQTLMQLDLIDEYRLNINPVMLGSGVKLFSESDAIKPLKLIESTTYKCGVVGLVYEPDRSKNSES